MKKLMLALAAVACASAVQASAVNWVCDSAITGVEDGFKVWTFIASDTSATSPKALAIADAVAMIGQDGWVTALKDNYRQKAATWSSGISTGYTTDNPSWGNNVTIAGYAIVFDSTDTNLSDATKYLVLPAKDVITFANDGQEPSFDLGKSTAYEWTTIGAVPEPTSGLLLLLGVAGLALRRRRA